MNSAFGRPPAQAATLHRGLRIKRPSYRAARPDFTRKMSCIDTLNEVSMFTQQNVANSVSQAFNCLFLASYHLHHASQFNNEPKAREARASLIRLAWINSHQNEGTLREHQGQIKTFFQEEQALCDSEPWGAGQTEPTCNDPNNIEGTWSSNYFEAFLFPTSHSFMTGNSRNRLNNSRE